MRPTVPVAQLPRTTLSVNSHYICASDARFELTGIVRVYKQKVGDLDYTSQIAQFYCGGLVLSVCFFLVERSYVKPFASCGQTLAITLRLILSQWIFLVKHFCFCGFYCCRDVLIGKAVRSLGL